MQRCHLGIHGTHQAGEETRLALVLNADGMPEYLHGDDAASAGRFARVIRGFVGGGRLPKPVAIKIERDDLPPGVGPAKFLSEYQAQQDVHKDLGDGERTRVVRMFEMWHLEEGQLCDQLPPTLICPRSRRILAPRCPCGQELRDVGRCPLGCSQASPDEVRAASSCEECRRGGVTCAAYWLTKRICKMIVLELLDVDLGEYVRWRWHDHTPQPRAAWTKYTTEHYPAWRDRLRQQGALNQPLTTALGELEFLLGVYNDALCGVQELHRKQIPHLDLKPANLCLALEGAQARLKVIDLGQADDPRVRWEVRQRSINDDATNRLRDLIYSAPEQLPERIFLFECAWRPVSGGCQLWITPDVKGDVRPGDWCYVTEPGGESRFHRLVAVDKVGDSRIATAWAIAPEAAWPAIAPSAEDPGSPWLPATSVGLVQMAGVAADLFALGMVLLFLLTRGRVNLAPIRDDLGHLEDELARLADTATGRNRPPRALVDALFRDTPPAALAPLVDRLRATPRELRELEKELIGIALQAILRGVARWSYTAHRNDGPPEALQRMIDDVAAVRRRLRVLVRSHELHAGRVAEQRKTGVARLRAWMKTQEGLPGNGLPPRYSRERLCETFDFLALEAARDDREFEYLLDYYHRDLPSLEKDLELFEKELAAKLLSVDNIHPVVDKLFQLLAPSPSPELLKAREKLDQVRDASRRRLQDLSRLLEAIDPEVSVIRFTDVSAEEPRLIRGDLLSLKDQIGRDAGVVLSWLRDLQNQQERLLEEWQRLNETASWQKFGTDLRAQLKAQLVEREKWISNIRLIIKYIGELDTLIDQALIAPWPEARQQFRRSARGLWRRLVAWVRRKACEMPLRVAPEHSDQIRKIERVLRGALDRMRALPPTGPVAKTPAVGASSSRVQVIPLTSESE